ncbi:MAG: hypothetical protein ACE5JH_02840 [Acidobacteriota bacterium]
MNARVDIHPDVVERAVWAALGRASAAGSFHSEREAAYEVRDPEQRDAAFARLHASWFGRMGLDLPIRQAIEEQEGALCPVRRWLLVPATGGRTRGAELYVDGNDLRSVLIAVRPEILLAPRRALRFLRRELLHIADILDPSFGYEPRLPPQPAGPAHDRILQRRYGILWGCSVDGRLLAKGWIEADARGARLEEFRRAFPSLGREVERGFARFFEGPRGTHRDLVAVASDPEGFLRLSRSDPPSPGRCPLCGFPTAHLDPAPETLPRPAVDCILSTFPRWRAEQGICPQCADLYRSRRLSDEAAARLPAAARERRAEITHPGGSAPEPPGRGSRTSRPR